MINFRQRALQIGIDNYAQVYYNFCITKIYYAFASLLPRVYYAITYKSRVYHTYVRIFSEVHKKGRPVMSELYDRIARIAQEKGHSITSMCRESGASRSSLTDLKMGRKQGLSSETLRKLASCLGVSVDTLLGHTPTDLHRMSNEELKFALWGDSANIDDRDLEDVLNYAAFLAQRKKEK